MISFILLSSLAPAAVSFTVGSKISDRRCVPELPILCPRRSPPVMLIPELGAVDLTIAVVSAMAGAASQIPRVNDLEEQRAALERELSVSKEALSEVSVSQSRKAVSALVHVKGSLTFSMHPSPFVSQSLLV